VWRTGTWAPGPAGPHRSSPVHPGDPHRLKRQETPARTESRRTPSDPRAQVLDASFSDRPEALRCSNGSEDQGQARMLRVALTRRFTRLGIGAAVGHSRPAVLHSEQSNRYSPASKPATRQERGRSRSDPIRARREFLNPGPPSSCSSVVVPTFPVDHGTYGSRPERPDRSGPRTGRPFSTRAALLDQAGVSPPSGLVCASQTSVASTRRPHHKHSGHGRIAATGPLRPATPRALRAHCSPVRRGPCRLNYPHLARVRVGNAHSHRASFTVDWIRRVSINAVPWWGLGSPSRPWVADAPGRTAVAHPAALWIAWCPAKAGGA